MSDPVVSIVVPTCDRRELIARCVDALARQDHASYEIIVVDDCSSDGSVEALEQFAAENPAVDITLLRNEHHLGANPSRNRGIAHARGTYIAFLDSDCIAAPDWLSELMAGFGDDEQIAAVTGLVLDPEPQNVYELTFKGTHRMGAAGPAHRLVAGNMAVRRDLLMEFMLDDDRAGPQPTDATGRPDTAVSGRGDEEGLALMLKAAGYQLRAVPDAVVHHEHYYTRRTFFRQAYRGGRSAARLVYKYYLWPRIDVLPFLAAWVALPLSLIAAVVLSPPPIWWLLLLVPLGCYMLGLAAISYNDLVRKGKKIGEYLRSLPILIAYYHVRSFAYGREALRLMIVGDGDIERVRL